MPARNQIGIYVPVSAVFPEITSDLATFRSLLRDLSRTDTLFWCARINHMVSVKTGVDSVAAQQSCIKQFFTSNEINRINDFVLSYDNNRMVTVFFRGQLLELFRWVTLFCIDHPGDGNTYEYPEIRKKFAQAALIASDVWANHTFKEKYSLDGGIELARQRALGPNMMSSQAATSAPPMTQSLGRGWALFNYYFSKYYPSFSSEFSSVARISVEQYFVCFAAMYTSFVNPRMGTGIFDIKKIQEHLRFGNIFSKYLELESQTPDDIMQALWSTTSDIYQYEDAPSEYYRCLREKPILHTDNGRGIIFDPIFYSDKAAIGPLFHILKSPRCKPNDAFMAFGQAFEDYSLDILSRMFASNENLVNRFKRNVRVCGNNGKNIEIDAILNDVIEVVLFEIKSGFIPENIILHNDYKPLLNTLQERYSINEDKKGVTRLKGVGQLARSAEALATGNWKDDRGEFQVLKIIYPVLIVHDRFLTSPLYGNFFSNEFASHLHADSKRRDGTFVKGDKAIAPVIVISINDLENLEKSIEHFGFRDLLSAYAAACPDRIMSLHDFIATDDSYRDLVYHNPTLAGFALEILDKCGKFVFDMEFGD